MPSPRENEGSVRVAQLLKNNTYAEYHSFDAT